MRQAVTISGIILALAAPLAAQSPSPAAKAPTARAAQEQVNKTAAAALEVSPKLGIAAEDIPVPMSDPPPGSTVEPYPPPRGNAANPFGLQSASTASISAGCC